MCAVMRPGDLLWPHWLIDSWVPFHPLWGYPHVYSQQGESRSVLRICHLPPWPPGTALISVHVNITGSEFPIMAPHTTSPCMLWQGGLTYSTCKRSNNLHQLNSNGKFLVMHKVSSETTGMFSDQSNTEEAHVWTCTPKPWLRPAAQALQMSVSCLTFQNQVSCKNVPQSRTRR